MKLIPNLNPIDTIAIQELGIPGILLMEEAGRRVALKVHKLAESKGLTHPKITVVCGKGNNGGDGFVAARRLVMLGYTDIQVIHLGDSAALKGDTLTNSKLLAHTPVQVFSSVLAERMCEALTEADIVIDALLGSGLSRPVDGTIRDVVESINASGAFCVAVDLPSGVHSETGQVLGIAVNADVTVTFAAPKPGLYLYPGKGHAGEVEIVDIGIPYRLIEADASKIHLITASMVKKHMPKRQGLSHKYTYGHVLVVAGSRDMPGAAVMAAEAALKAGVGLVTLAAPASALSRMTLPPEILCLNLPENDRGQICPASITTIIDALGKASTVLIGPGMGLSDETCQATENLIGHLKSTTLPVVLDADALNVLSQRPKLCPLNPQWILTPHIGEAARLIGWEKLAIQNDQLAAIEALYQQYQSMLVLKSASSVLYGNHNRRWINPTGNAGMATAGSGDILAGLIAGFLAQGSYPDEATRCAVYLHGLSGDIAAAELTPYSLSATDLLRFLPAAIKQVMS